MFNYRLNVQKCLGDPFVPSNFTQNKDLVYEGKFPTQIMYKDTSEIRLIKFIFYNEIIFYKQIMKYRVFMKNIDSQDLFPPIQN